MVARFKRFFTSRFHLFVCGPRHLGDDEGAAETEGVNLDATSLKLPSLLLGIDNAVSKDDPMAHYLS